MNIDMPNRLNAYRNQLRTLARSQLNRQLHRRTSPSDIVQETFIRSLTSIKQFRGTTEGEFAAWLHAILSRVIQSAVEREMLAEKRDLRREVALSDKLASDHEESMQMLGEAIFCRLPSPSSVASRNERAEELANQIAKLPADYREVIILRSLKSLSFDVIAKQMGKPSGSVRAMWVRALAKLTYIANSNHDR